MKLKNIFTILITGLFLIISNASASKYGQYPQYFVWGKNSINMNTASLVYCKDEKLVQVYHRHRNPVLIKLENITCDEFHRKFIECSLSYKVGTAARIKETNIRKNCFFIGSEQYK